MTYIGQWHILIITVLHYTIYDYDMIDVLKHLIGINHNL